MYNLEGLIEFKKQQFHNETQRVYSAVDTVPVLVNGRFIKSKTCAARYFLCCLRAEMRLDLKQARVDLQHACFSCTAVAGGSPAALGGTFPCVQREMPPQQLFSSTCPCSEMPLFHLESCHGQWIVLARCLHQLQSLLGTASFQ